MFKLRACLIGIFAVFSAACPSIASSEDQIDPALIGRALGFDLSYERECVGVVPPSQGQLVYLVEYSRALVQFSRRLSDVGRDDFLLEFIHSSVRTQFQCERALGERDAYWAALESKGMSKRCLIELISKESDLNTCGTIAQ
jgi:hypothetical protein